MDLRVFIEPQQGATYEDQLRLAKAAEETGYSAFFRSDHFVAMGDDFGLPGPTDSWVTLAGLARETSTIRLGTLVTSATFRHPSLLAIQVAQVDAMSMGRVELGLGAGWFDREHDAYGFELPPVRERFDRFEEQLEVITGLWRTPAGETFSHDGAFYRLQESPALPKPVQKPIPMIIGGGGKRRTPALAARFATEFNLPFQALDATSEQFSRVRAACEAAGRDATDLTWSVAQVLCVGKDDAELTRRADAIGRDIAELVENGVAGSVEQAVDRLARFAEIGVDRVYLQVLDIEDLDHIGLVAESVRPQLG